MACRMYTLVFLILLCYQYTSADVYASVATLQKLWVAEASLISTIEQNIEQLANKVDMVSKFIENIGILIKKKEKRFHDTPLSTYSSLRRITQDWADAETVLKTVETNIDFSNLMEEGPFEPSVENVKGAALGLIRLQNTYKLKTEDIAGGILNGKQVSTPMSANDCFHLGLRLMEQHKYSDANKWLLQARSMLDQVKETSPILDFPTLFDEDVLPILIKSLIGSGNLKLAARLNKKLQMTSQDKQNMAKENAKLIADALVQQRLDLPNTYEWKERRNETVFTKVCSGEDRQSPTEQRHLRCRYICHVKPDCIISPYRLEEYSLDPFVGVVHDVIFEKEMEFIRNQSLNELSRSMVVGQDTITLNEVRTSKTRWMDFKKHDILRNLEHRLLQMTGLSLQYNESLQVVNYGIGGHYYPHYDAVGSQFTSFENLGDRILTALLYINHVEMGGATAFPYLKIAVPPKKGAALIWYNLHKNLELDYRTYHTGCPVLKGSKWITNQWFHAFGQEFKRPCGLEPDPSTVEYFFSHLKE